MRARDKIGASRDRRKPQATQSTAERGHAGRRSRRGSPQRVTPAACGLVVVLSVFSLAPAGVSFVFGDRNFDCRSIILYIYRTSLLMPDSDTPACAPAPRGPARERVYTPHRTRDSPTMAMCMMDEDATGTGEGRRAAAMQALRTAVTRFSAAEAVPRSVCSTPDPSAVAGKPPRCAALLCSRDSSAS